MSWSYFAKHLLIQNLNNCKLIFLNLIKKSSGLNHSLNQQQLNHMTKSFSSLIWKLVKPAVSTNLVFHLLIYRKALKKMGDCLQIYDYYLLVPTRFFLQN